MKNQKIYPIGYLMKALHITYSDLARAIYIDRSVVNKWALGKRKFGKNSPHYQKVVDYLIHVNEINDDEILQSFFKKIYPNLACEEPYIRNCIDHFLEQQEIIANTGGTIVSRAENVLYYTAPISNTAFGRFAALLDLLDKTLLSNKTLNITLYDNEQFEWLTEDEFYCDQFIKVIKSVLEKGHNVTFISEVDYLSRYYHFANNMQSFYNYSNFTEYYFMSNKNPELVYSYYFVEGERVVTGNRLLNNSLYTITLSDPYSIESHNAKYLYHLKKCILHKMVKTEKDRLQLINFIDVVQKSKEITYLYTNGLSFLSMSLHLLEDVLKKNKVYGDKKNKILELRKSYELHTYHREVSFPSFRQLCYLRSIEDLFTQDKVPYLDLSLLIGRKVYVDRTQVYEHVKDTIQLLAQSKNYSIGLLRETSDFRDVGYTHLCVKNQYYISFYNVLRCTQEISIVNSIAELMENEWNQNIPFEFVDNHCVVERLKKLIEL